MRLLVLLILVLPLAACRPPGYVWVAPDATVDRIDFLLGREPDEVEPVYVAFLRVDRCGIADYQRPGLWMIEFAGTDMKQSEIDRLTYGVVPPGFNEITAPESLGPGCYELTITPASPGTVRFEIARDRSLTEVAAR